MESYCGAECNFMVHMTVLLISVYNLQFHFSHPGKFKIAKWFSVFLLYKKTRRYFIIKVCHKKSFLLDVQPKLAFPSILWPLTVLPTERLSYCTAGFSKIKVTAQQMKNWIEPQITILILLFMLRQLWQAENTIFDAISCWQANNLKSSCKPFKGSVETREQQRFFLLLWKDF